MKHKSDHFPLLLDLQLNTSTYATSFKFMRMWTTHEDCEKIVKDCWDMAVVGCHMLVLTKKLKALKEKLKSWNKTCFGIVHENVKHAESKLQEIQNQIQAIGHNDDLLNAEKEAHKLFEDALNREEMFWQEKARLNWHLHGDGYTEFFHRIAKIKTSTKLITTLQDGDHVLTEKSQIANHVTSYYKNLFCTNFVLQDSLLAEEVIPTLIIDEVNRMLTMLPSHQEIKAAIFALNKDSAPGPDGFGAFFFQHYWDIVKGDLIDAVLQCFATSWILPGYNSNIIALIPKIHNAVSIEQYRPISMSNFKFNVISKIIADRLAQVMPSIISKEQMGFIHDRNIKDCICIASEAANLLHNKAFGGNLALKIDITKAFDTLEWPFLLQVLKKFGFNDIFCTWIDVILKFAFLSISINGESHGYFNCTKGARQGDPLSPLLFCIAEDVHSRSLKKLVEIGKLKLIKGTINFNVPSHSFYADDLMIFLQRKHLCLQSLKHLFSRYAITSGQVINTSKSTIYSNSINQVRLNHIVLLLNFNIGSLPFNYLGIPIFKGKPKVCHLQPIADRIKLKLSNWKSSLLSMVERVRLVQSVIQSMLIYNISIYAWPTSLLKDLEKDIKNFIWSGDKEKRKLISVSWKKVCRLYVQGGLNLRSLINLNQATKLKFCWNLLNSNQPWALLMKDMVIRNKKTIKHHIFSSLWSGIKDEYKIIQDNTIWL